MKTDKIEASLTRKLRQLADLPEVVLTPEEADLFRIQTIDQLTFDELIEEEGDKQDE